MSGNTESKRVTSMDLVGLSDSERAVAVAGDPRWTPVNGLVPFSVMGYYACCATDTTPCDLVAFRLPDGRTTEFLLGRIDSDHPRQLWRRAGFSVPRGVRLLQRVHVEPCVRDDPMGVEHSAEPHEWWTWDWA